MRFRAFPAGSDCQGQSTLTIDLRHAIPRGGMAEGRWSALGGLIMKKLWMPVALVAAVFLALPSPAGAQKGKGNGKGHSVVPAPSNVLPLGKGKDDPLPPLEHPNTGNSLPPSV